LGNPVKPRFHLKMTDALPGTLDRCVFVPHSRSRSSSPAA
jgi:hypothetical protein